MANLMDYLDWRGDLTFLQAPFNEVDNLILAELAFVDLHGIVPGIDGGEGVTLRDAAARYFADGRGKVLESSVLVPALISDMAISRPTNTFCTLPPESFLTGVLTLGVTTSSSFTTVSASFLGFFRSAKTPRPVR